mmetsp:Transcript_25938/g.29871  ORF Transcript_25938/g.29871 Transcript_25938/m.29871 type:complete len:611 (+) Transcript_25938:3604-5436(+)
MNGGSTNEIVSPGFTSRFMGINSKLFAMAKYRAINELVVLTKIETLEDDREKGRRAISRDMLRGANMKRRGVSNDEKNLRILKASAEKDADLDFPDIKGETVLWKACFYHNHACIEWLLNQGASPNIQSFDDGSTAIHAAPNNNSYSDSIIKHTIELLRDHEPLPNSPSNGADFSILNHWGATPFMHYSLMNTVNSPDNQLQNTEIFGALRPWPSWEEVEALLCNNDLSIEELCVALLDLLALSNPKGSRALRRLRLLDMLFCKHEGDIEELTQRQKIFFDKFIRRSVLRSVQEPKIDRDFLDIISYVLNQFLGPPKERENTRSAYKHQFNVSFKSCHNSLENIYGNELDRLYAEDPDIETLFSFPKISSKLDDIELMHGRFTERPQWAIEKDLPTAVRALQQVGIIQSAAMFCDLIQHGRHRLLQTPNPQLFREGPKSLRFWVALVLLWSIGIQEKIYYQFNKEMKSVAGGAFSKAPGVKDFKRSFEQAFEKITEIGLKGWEQQVLAGLYIIDGLRCVFTVDTAEENIAVGKRLKAKFLVIRTKNSHEPNNRSYAGRKYNLLFSTEAEGIGKVAFLCEVQIHMNRYAEIKKIGHLLSLFKLEGNSKEFG